jgi:hypothetical protein
MNYASFSHDSDVGAAAMLALLTEFAIFTIQMAQKSITGHTQSLQYTDWLLHGRVKNPFQKQTCHLVWTLVRKCSRVWLLGCTHQVRKFYNHILGPPFTCICSLFNDADGNSGYTYSVEWMDGSQ